MAWPEPKAKPTRRPRRLRYASCLHFSVEIQCSERQSCLYLKPNILFTVHEGAPFVGGDLNAHNLLQKGALL
jgi:hypothetical protein